MRIVRRIAEVLREGGLPGVARQTASKLEYWRHRLTFRPHVIQKSLAGHNFQVAINNLFAEGWIELRHRWPELEWLKEHFLQPGDIVADCGANMGFTTIFFAHCVGPTGRVVAFEPIPSNADDIRQNIALNRLQNVDVHEVAVGSAHGTATLSHAPNAYIGAAANSRTITVPMISLDSAFPATPPTLIKIDVEGHELEVLQGAARILQACPKLDIEVHPLYKTDKLAHCQAVFDTVFSHPYRIYLQREIDGPIEEFNDSPDSLAALAAQPVFHIFARPLGSAH